MRNDGNEYAKTASGRGVAQPAEALHEYWNERFLSGGLLWGESPSPIAVEAVERFSRAGVRRVLVPGAGYGRNARLFSESGFEVEAIELSEEAASMGADFAPRVGYRVASALDEGTAGWSVPPNAAEAVFCYDLIHLFLEQDRRRLVENLVRWMAPGGLLMLSAFSTQDETHGVGRLVEPGTFEVKPGKLVHFMQPGDFASLHPLLALIDVAEVEEQVRTDARSETWRLVRAYFKKVGCAVP